MKYVQIPLIRNSSSDIGEICKVVLANFGRFDVLSVMEVTVNRAHILMGTGLQCITCKISKSMMDSLQ